MRTKKQQPLILTGNRLYTRSEALGWFGGVFEWAFADKSITPDSVFGVNVGFKGQTLHDWAIKNGFGVQLAPDGTAPRA
jgi:hypothetical protein